MNAFFNYFTLGAQENVPKSNDYFIELMQKYEDIWALAQQQSNRVICCPSTASLKYDVRRDDLERHVLIPIGGGGEFVSLKGDKVVFSGGDLIVNNAKRVRVMDVEYLPNKYGIVIYRISNSLSSQGDQFASTDDSEEISPETLLVYINLLRSIPASSLILSKLDKYLTKLCDMDLYDDGRRCRMRSSFITEVQENWMGVTESLKQAGMTALLPKDSDESLMGRIIETYIMNEISPTILPWFKESTAKADRAIHLQIMCLRNRSQTDLGIPAEFQAQHINAIAALARLQHATTPVDKLVVLKNVSSMIRYNVQMNIDRNGYRSEVELATGSLSFLQYSDLNDHE